MVSNVWVMQRSFIFVMEMTYKPDETISSMTVFYANIAVPQKLLGYIDRKSDKDQRKNILGT